MRIGLCQLAGTFGEVEANLGQMWQQMENAARAEIDLLVFPELYVTGYNLGGRVGELAFPRDGELASRIAGRAAENGVAVLYGYPERDGRSISNSAQLVDAKGRTLANYRKTHLFGDWERRVFEPGDAFVSAELCGLRVGLLICYDVEFPETVRRYACEDVELVLVPTALMAPFEFVARFVVPARACENQIFVAYANRCGTEGDLRYLGRSCVCGPDGEILAQAESAEGLIVAKLEPGVIRRSRQGYTYLADRRQDLYLPAALSARRRDTD